MTKRRIAGVVLIAIGAIIFGWSLAVATPSPPGGEGVRTFTTTIRPPAKTIRLPGRVIRRVDHVLIVQTPRYVFMYRGRRRVLPPKIVRVYFRDPFPEHAPVIAAIVGGIPTPATVTVPVTVPVPGPTSTITVDHTLTEPTTITDTITITVTLGGPPGGSQ